ncbi:cyanophycin synthetase [Parvularcula sp. IMCC14364]|uniref:cyanophycin synthetase n=1 Tax=Parvularcula sp. IMCC14364 TaxID=3067902 RepID=UPI0027413DD2|nr:cyanophycin synthetase [Parvularcula sp. IMCC14364]
MKLLSSSVYVGPNIFSQKPLMRFTIDFGKYAGRRAADFGDSLLDPLVKALPGLAQEETDTGELFLDRLRDAPDCDLGELVARVAVTLQKLAAAPVNIARSEPSGEEGVREVLFGYVSRRIGLEAGDLARLIVLELIDPSPSGKFNLADEIDDFFHFASRRSLGPSAMAIVQAAEERDIPWIRLNQDSLIQLGQGRYQKRIEAALSSQTASIAVDIAKDKEFCTQLLYDLGLPVPEQKYVRNSIEAVAAAERIGYPVVVKPVDGNHGRGVSINLDREADVLDAFDKAVEHGSGVIVEKMIEGADHRLLVVNGVLVAAAKRVPAHVKGDGRSTIDELVERENQDPRRGVGHENMLTRLELDQGAQKMLREQQLDTKAVLEEGQVAYLRRTANLSTGGTAVDVTDTIHPDNKFMAERAIKAVGLDIGGVDFLTTDITKSYRETGGAICEINAGPGIRMHISPSEGTPRDVGGAVMDMLFPPGTPSRIPIAALTGTNGKTTTSRMLGHILKMSGHVVGQTSTDAVSIDGNVTVKGDMTGPMAASMVLRDPDVDIAVMETARGGIVRAGLGYQYCDVGAVLNVSSDHLGMGGVETLDDLARVKRLVVEVARDTAVLNADNIHTLQMAQYTKARHICYVSRNPNNGLVREHIKQGHRAVVLERGTNGEQIVLYDRDNQIPLIWTHLIPATVEGKAIHNVENAMFAAAMSYSLGLTLDQIRAGLRTFNNTFYQSPGRMNVFDEHGFRVILDYGHNEAAIAAMADLVERLEPRGKRIVCVTCPGDRRDEDVTANANAVAGKFDKYICHTDDDLRGRAPREIPEMMRDALIAAGVDPAAIEVIPDEVEAVDRALEQARRNDLLLLFCAAITRTWKQIIYYSPIDKPDERIEPESEPDIDINVPEGYRIVKDDRGVWLALKD